MSGKSEIAIVEDRVTTRMWELDLSQAGKVRSPKKRPTKHRRQQIARFLERDGLVEKFAIRQTIPHPGYDAECPPSQLQYGAVTDFFVEGCETRSQAKTLLSAKDYAAAIARSAPYSAPRRHFIWLCATAFILADKDLRSRVRAWSIACFSKGYTDISVGIAHHKPYKLVSGFASRLIDDMRAQGAQIFG